MIETRIDVEISSSIRLANTERGVVDQITDTCFNGDIAWFDGWWEVISQFIDWDTYIDMAIREGWTLNDLIADIGATASP